MTTELRRELVGDELDFFNGLQRESAGTQLWGSLQRQPLRKVICAIDIRSKVPDLAPTHIEGVGAGPAGHHVGIKREDAEIVPLLNRKILKRRAIDRAGDFSRCRLHERRYVGNSNRFVNRRNL